MKKHLFFYIALCCICLTANFAKAQNSETISDSLFSKTLNEQRQFWVQLPENYNASTALTYPVVYVLDGMSLENTLKTVYDNYWGHYLPHMILVGISNRENRTRDLTISQIETRRGSQMNGETGGADKFTNFIENELMPHIDTHYKTTPYRTLIGHSYAGLFTINTLLNHQHLFTNYIAIDPSLDWDNQNILHQAKTKLVSGNYKGKSLFVSLAAEQLHMQDEGVTMDNLMDDTSGFSLFARSIVEFSELASSQPQSGLSFNWKVYPEDLHGTVPLPTMRDGLVEQFKWYQFKSPQKYNNPETSVETLTGLLEEQERIYTKHLGYKSPPMLEELFNAYGYMWMQMGSPEKSELFFKMGVKYYPESVNALDSLAEFYTSQNDVSSAVTYLKKAFELSGEAKYNESINALTKKKN